LLRRLNLRRLAVEDGSADQFNHLFGKERAAMGASLFDAVSDYDS